MLYILANIETIALIATTKSIALRRPDSAIYCDIIVIALYYILKTIAVTATRFGVALRHHIFS